MKYYTSDLHLGHEAIISMCNRPFKTVEEMDEALIFNWNKTVHKNDEVYILGDLIYKSSKSPEYYLERLKGIKHLIIGNHDEDWIDKIDKAKYFQSWSHLDIINTGYGKASLCHFPMVDHEGRYLIHGHIHANTDQAYWNLLKDSERPLNAGVDINGYKPVSFAELLENNQRFKQQR